MHITGAIEQPHIRSWSRVLHVPTETGHVFSKVFTLALVHEAGVTDALAT